jgi:hypothetical protein
MAQRSLGSPRTSLITNLQVIPSFSLKQEYTLSQPGITDKLSLTPSLLPWSHSHFKLFSEKLRKKNFPD